MQCVQQKAFDMKTKIQITENSVILHGRHIHTSYTLHNKWDFSCDFNIATRASAIINCNIIMNGWKDGWIDGYGVE